jgi:hypothetical protein
MGFRASPVMRASVVRWAENQPDNPSLSEAIRRLVEIGLSKPSDQPRVLSTSTEGAARADELAGKVIDKKIDPKAPAEEREVRKRKLVKGPGEFRNARVDRPKVRGK